ncbi:transglutaminaseTgpA domain-containing protein [Natrarchaeobaculum sulfurireducens]|uniref:Transglutaminase-like domain-containing protein n=1 Tax=Natrarchaeobaculum sulfurireducens TaxID=2044521 RepID=A0A346PAT6_9EURY|nr:transglutaminaseTgpA domain-containing protein [Natrarchaeobaculum sulfurireducens]AXR76631.1 hypothetical protein AArc1_0287 [Natrarchaeobaculum sulfurireducens]
MSTDAGIHGRTTVQLVGDGTAGPRTFRLLALGSVLVLSASYVSVLQEVTRVVGGTESLFALAGAMIVLATVLARTIRPWTAAALALAAGSIGFVYYLEVAGVGVDALVSATDGVVGDTLTLATGMPVLQMVEAGTWTLAFVPAPVFLSWYLALRGRYALSVVPGGLALCFLVLTGDAGTIVTLLGTLSAIAAVGFGELARRGGSVAQVDLIAVLLALVIVLSLSVTFVPSGPATPTTAASGGEGTLEGTIDAEPERSGIAGAVDLSPEPRFTVESEQPSYWRTGVYDRYTGDEWLRSGQETALEGDLETPPGEFETVEQEVRAERTLHVIPAATQPLSIDGPIADDATVSAHGQLYPDSILAADETYTVESAVADPEPEELQHAGEIYPEEITEHYLQRPESTSSAFDERTAEITADAETPYETAAAIEAYLRSSKEYSLEVDRPDGDVAEAFLLEMDEGYCVYFATTMTQMLRAEDVPARYATGYTAGEEVDENTYTVRGLDAHAWVEVYFPGHGWVPFEPTPPADRETAHEAYADGTPAETPHDAEVDDGQQPDEDVGDELNATDGYAESPTDGNDSEEFLSGNGEYGEEANHGTDAEEPSEDPEVGTGESSTDEEPSLELSIPRETAAIGAVLLVGLAAGVRRTGAVARTRRLTGLYWHGRRGDPDADAKRAFRRLEGLLAREYRPRRPNESARRYLQALERAGDDGPACDPRTEAVLDCYERAVYGGGVTRDEADDAIERVNGLVRGQLPILGQRRS